MAGSVYGERFRVMTWGESHGKGIGVVVDGCPAGLSLEEADIQALLDRRRPGQSRFTTQRDEADAVEILSGVFEGRTTGTPISLEVRNKDQRSRDYSAIKDIYRPGHADFTYDAKYGFRDYRGGGRSSGRETIGRVAAGAIAQKLLGTLGIGVRAYTKAVGGIAVDPARFDLEKMWENRLYMPDPKAAEEAEAFLAEAMARKDSVGGVAECVITGLPAGIGEPVFDKLDACLAKAVLSIGGVKGFEVGDGFRAAKALGSENNDPFRLDKAGRAETGTNHAGGILGGISDGAPVVFRAAIKPTPSIASVQQTVTRDVKEQELEIKGRHDPIIVPRAVVVVEAMAALTVADLLLTGMMSRMEWVHKIYGGPYEDRDGK